MKPRPNDGANLSILTNNNSPVNYGHIHPGLGNHPNHGGHMQQHGHGGHGAHGAHGGHAGHGGHGPTTLSPVRQPAQYNSHNTMEQFGHCPKVLTSNLVESEI